MKFEGVRSVSFPAVSPWPLRVMLRQVRSMLQLGEDYVRRLDEDEGGEAAARCRRCFRGGGRRVEEVGVKGRRAGDRRDVVWSEQQTDSDCECEWCTGRVLLRRRGVFQPLLEPNNRVEPCSWMHLTRE